MAVLAAFLCLGQVQSVCDPTCTHGLCLAQLAHEPSEKFCREALPVIAVFLLLGLSYASWGQRVLDGSSMVVHSRQALRNIESPSP